MHLDSAFRAQQYPELLVQLLERTLGREVSLPAPLLHRPTPELGYRSRARLHVEARGRQVRLGFRAPRSRDLVEPDPCLVLEPEMAASFAPLRGLFVGTSGEGELQIAWGERDEHRALVLELRWNGELPSTIYARLDAAIRAPLGPSLGDTASLRLAGARVWIEGAQAPLVYGDPRPVQRAADGLPMRLAAGGFAQPSDAGAALLSARVRALADCKEQRVVELFAGSGTLSIGLAADARELSTTELDPAAVECARENLARRGLDARIAVGDAEARELKGRPDVVVLDPPRTGAPRAVASIAAHKPRRIVYVSCEPSTLARDLAPLVAAGYAIEVLELVELFPQTSHVETIALIGRQRPSRSASEP
jgi:23S rRNA (uracil1939-C5)-methyltransferase